MSVGVEDFIKFINESEHTGRVRICAEFNVKEDQIDAFKAEMQKGIEKTLKEKGCTQVIHKNKCFSFFEISFYCCIYTLQRI